MRVHKSLQLPCLVKVEEAAVNVTDVRARKHACPLGSIPWACWRHLSFFQIGWRRGLAANLHTFQNGAHLDPCDWFPPTTPRFRLGRRFEVSSWSYGHRPDSDPVVPLSSIELLRSTGSASSLRPKKKSDRSCVLQTDSGFHRSLFYSSLSLGVW